MREFSLMSTVALALLAVVAAGVESASSFTCASNLPYNPNNASSYRVSNLPKLTASAAQALQNGQYAGYIPISSDPSDPENMFFWFFPSAQPTSQDLVIWLNGGPGCSSLFGSFIENGPVTILADGTVDSSPNSWHQYANVLYVEQPLGAGYSDNTNVKSGPKSEFDVGSQFLVFLNGFYAAFPQTRSWSLYLTGESYAGVYIPFIAGAIQTCPGVPEPIPFKGIALNDAILSFPAQIGPRSTVAAFDYLHLAGYFQRTDPSGALEHAAAQLADMCRGETRHDPRCDLVMLIRGWYEATYPGGDACLDYYNIRGTVPCDKSGQYWREEARLKAYLNSPSVRQAMHVDPWLANQNASYQWGECNDISITIPGDAQSGPNSETFLPGLVASGVKVILYNGDQDLLVNYVSVEEVLGNLTWNGATGFQTSPQRWIVDDGEAGIEWQARGLTYIRVFGSGHMVAANKPQAGIAVLQRLLGAGATTRPSASIAMTPAYISPPVASVKTEVGSLVIEAKAAATMSEAMTSIKSFGASHRASIFMLLTTLFFIVWA
ncbi:serine carboxypeptidase-domain-containing protein [Chytriomyces sp. MP71]|nr:serine carboxypeptidase-domain-containing protein [Chytriomyces sp. MP71]